jgi:hypothetical protein
MLWTTNRQTREEEDGAYCLLRIFGINIPLIYGEGREEALQRLRREVDKSSNKVETNIALFIVPFEKNA